MGNPVNSNSVMHHVGLVKAATSFIASVVVVIVVVVAAAATAVVDVVVVCCCWLLVVVIADLVWLCEGDREAGYVSILRLSSCQAGLVECDVSGPLIVSCMAFHWTSDVLLFFA